MHLSFCSIYLKSVEPSDYHVRGIFEKDINRGIDGIQHSSVTR